MSLLTPVSVEPTAELDRLGDQIAELSACIRGRSGTREPATGRALIGRERRAC